MALFKTATKDTKATKPKKAADTSMKALYADDAPVTTAEKAKKGGTTMSHAHRVLVRPLISEKASRQQSLNQYFFAVAIDANRIEVAKAVKAVYGVTPTKVTIIRNEGKVRRMGRTTGRRKDWKKAMVSLPKGKTISLYEGV